MKLYALYFLRKKGGREQLLMVDSEKKCQTYRDARLATKNSKAGNGFYRLDVAEEGLKTYKRQSTQRESGYIGKNGWNPHIGVLMLRFLLVASVLLSLGCIDFSQKAQIGRNPNLIPPGATNIEYVGSDWVRYTLHEQTFYFRIDGIGNCKTAIVVPVGKLE